MTNEFQTQDSDGERPSRTQTPNSQQSARSNAIAAISSLMILAALTFFGLLFVQRSDAQDDRPSASVPLETSSEVDVQNAPNESAAPNDSNSPNRSNALNNDVSNPPNVDDAEIVESVAGSIAAKKEEVRERRLSKENALPVKWLPDLKVLSGAPAATLELDDAIEQLCDDGYFGGEPGSVSPNDVELSILSGGGEIATPSLDGRSLRLEWKPQTLGKTKIIVKATLKSDAERAAFVTFNAESWAPNYWAICATVLGGLGLFLLGMKRMSDGLQAIAGARLRRLISIFTNNRFMAIGVGFLTTAIVQSSSATTVMVVGFINSGLMTLSQGIGVIMGTNVGTTATGWLLTLNVGKLGLPILGIGAFFYLFTKNERIRNFAMFSLGFGMVFFGLTTMSSGLAPLPEIPEFSELMRSFEATTLFGAFQCALVGCALTLLVQSSSATVGITMALTAIGAINFTTAAALVLGENVGTTITALLASIGTSASARRAAYFHTLFNLAGVCWALAIFFPILIPTVERLGNSLGFDAVAKIALTHSLFNIANTILFIPLIGPASYFLQKYVKETTNKPKRPSTTGLASFLDDEPIIGIERSRVEVQRMFADCGTLLDLLQMLKKENFEDRALVDRSFALEQKLDDAQDETIDFISRLTARAYTTDVAASAREQVRVAEELETISDYLTGAMKSNLKLKEELQRLPAQIDADFDELLQYAADSFRWIEKIYVEWSSRERLVAEMTARRARYVARVKEMREAFMQTIFNDRIAPTVVVAVDYQMNAWRRIYEHLQNIAEAMDAKTPKKV